MRTLSISLAVASLSLMVAACGSKNQQQPATAPTATGAYPGMAPAGQYPAGQYPQQGAPGAYPTATAAPGYGAPGAVPTATAPAAGGAMATPGPLAFSCQNDVPCGTHHCNMQYGKCAFPCQSANDCIAPNQCMAGLCVPLPAQTH